MSEPVAHLTPVKMPSVYGSPVLTLETLSRTLLTRRGKRRRWKVLGDSFNRVAAAERIKKPRRPVRLPRAARICKAFGGPHATGFETGPSGESRKS
jgi:hypothetical protein